MPQMYNLKRASLSLPWRGSITAFRSRLYLICRKSSATNETAIAQIGISVPTSSANNLNSCADLCAIWSVRAFRRVHVLRTPEEVEALRFSGSRSEQLKHEHGPFDSSGYPRCFEELVELLTQLGYSIERRNQPETVLRGISVKPPEAANLFSW